MAQTAISEQPNSLAGFQPPFKYSRSLTGEQIAELGATASKGHQLLRKVNQMLVDFGQELLEWQRELKKDFKAWLAHYFPELMAEVRQAMAIGGKLNRPLQDKNPIGPAVRGWQRECKFLLNRSPQRRKR